jgi:hypothetical protein
MNDDSRQSYGEPTQSPRVPPSEPPSTSDTAPPATPAATGGAPAATATTDDWIRRLVQPAQESRSWLKFLGVASIVIGGLSALTIVGLIYAWLYIWIGVLLWQAGDRAGWAYAQQSPFLLEQYLGKLRTIIVILGVVSAIHLVMTVLAIGFFFTLGGLAAVLNAFE